MPYRLENLRGRVISLGLSFSVLGAALVGACSPQATTGAASTGASTPSEAQTPTVRLYLLSTVAGALEPCGCSKDQLGGADHFASHVTAQKGKAESTLVLGAGPLFFQDPVIEADKRTQHQWKADALARAMKSVGLAAWAPGANDFADGQATFVDLTKATSASFLAANVSGSDGMKASTLIDVKGLKVGVIGLADPSSGLSKDAPKLTVSPPLDALKKEIAALKSQGAQVLIGLAAMQRGEALRLIDEVSDLDLLVVGKSVEKGDGNDAPKPPVLIGSTLIAETSNHLQTVSVVDLFVKDPKPGERIQFKDAGGIARAERMLELSKRIRDLEIRINGWERSGSVDKRDVAARKSELDGLKSELVNLEAEPDKPVEGSYFRYGLVEVRERLGQDPAVKEITLAYYKRVNDHNKVAFKDRKPEPAEEGKASYLGTDECTKCHEEERAVWDKTDHAKAYPTLEKQFVEYNLECVGCHVTGYEKPGGSTVTHVDGLKNVGCEVCHGPGSLHAKTPDKAGLIVKQPDPQSCVSECHHPPHVEGFDPKAKMSAILGKGHGL
jgi:hypothetical protein